MKICIYGASSDRIPEKYLSAAYEFGRALAKKGHSLVFGGGNTGVMGRAVRGVSAEGGYSIGIAPRFFDTDGILYKECDEFIFTDTMRERKALLEEHADAFAVLPGGIGTYEEFFETLVLCQLGQLDKPIAVYNADGCYSNLEALLKGTVTEGFMSEKCLGLFRFCTSAEEIFEYFSESIC